MRRSVAIIGILIAAVALVYMRQRTKDGAAQTRTPPAPTPATTRVAADAAPSRRQPRSSGFVSTDVHDPEFVQRVLPVVREFFATLDRAGVNPIKGELQFNKVQTLRGPNGMTCRFLIGDSWSATTHISEKFSGVMHFGERGPDNPFRAISDANTNALMRLSERAIRMPPEEAERITEHVANTFGVDRSKFEKPEMFPEKMFHYDLGMYTVQYRKKGSDPINQLNYPLSFSVRATSRTTAVLVMYSYSGQGGLGR